jgi:hypothetical protein
MSEIDELREEVAALRNEVSDLEGNQRTFVEWIYHLAAGDVQVMEWVMLSIRPPAAHTREASDRRELLHSDILDRLKAAEENAKLAEHGEDV